MTAVFGRYGTGPRSFGATFWNPGVETERTAKKRRKNEQKWARYGLTKRVRVADLLLMDRYLASMSLVYAWAPDAAYKNGTMAAWARRHRLHTARFPAGMAA